MILELLQSIFSVPVAMAQATDKSNSITSQTADHISSLAETIVQSIPLWITGAIVIIISFVLSRIVKNSVENKMTEQGFEENHKEMQIVISRAASAAVLTIGITVGLKIMGIDLTAVVAAAAFGIGFAMQDIIMNFVSGIIVLLQKQFTIGDWIIVNGTEGIVKEIQSRFTVIKTFDGTKVIVPNSELFKNQVTSLTSNPERRLKFNLSIDRYYDLKEVIDLVYKSIDKCDKILKKPKPSIIVTQPGPYFNNIKIRCWAESKKGILRPTSALIRQIHKDFYKRGWSWATPTQNIIMDKDLSAGVEQRAKNYEEKHKKIKKVPTVMDTKTTELPPLTAPQPTVPTVAVTPTTESAIQNPAIPAWLQQASQQTPTVSAQPATVPQVQNTPENLPNIQVVVPPIQEAEPKVNAILPLPDVQQPPVS